MTGSVVAGAAAASVSVEGGWSRLAGSDRYATSAAVAQAAFPDGAPLIYLARGDDPAGALAAGSLTDGPVLLVGPGGVPDATLRAIVELGPATVVALGGPDVVPEDVLDEAARAGGAERDTDRVAGADRYATAVAISQRAFPDGAGGAFFAAAMPDALAGGVLEEGPVLLVPEGATEFPPAIREEFARLGANVAHVLTGPAKLDPAGLRALDDTSSPDARVATFEWFGPERIATATRVASLHFGRIEVPTVYVASASDPIDAVAAGALTDGPIVLAPACGPLPDALTAELEVLDPARVVGLGGPEAVCDAVMQDIAAYAREPFPEPPAPGELTNATPAPDGHVEPFFGSLVTPLAWSRDGLRLLIHGTPPGRATGLGDDGGADVSPIGLYVHDTATGDLLPLRLPAGWWVDTPDQAALSPDGAEVYVGAARDDPNDPRSMENWVVAIAVDDGALRQVVRGSVQIATGSALLVRGEPRGASQRLTIIDTSDGSSWVPDADLAAGPRVVLAPDASAVLYGMDRTVRILHRDGTGDTVVEAESATACRAQSVVPHALSGGGAYAVVGSHWEPLPNPSSRCPVGPSDDVLVVEVDTGRWAPLVTSDGDAHGAALGEVAISQDGSTIAFRATPAAAAVATDEGGYAFEAAPDGVPFDGAPGPQDGERSMIYKVATEELVAGAAAYAAVSSGTPWEQAHLPAISPAGDRVAWKAEADGRAPDVPREVVLFRSYG